MRNPALKALLAMAVAGLFAGPPAARAQDAASPAATGPAPAPTAATVPVQLPAEHSWRLGVALGYGSRTNPLIQSDDIPVLVDVDIAWFGKRWFFDNGDIGFTAVDNRFFTANLMARVNSDRAFFSKTNTKYVTFARAGGGATLPAFDVTGGPLTQPVPLKPPKRDYAVEAGVEVLFGGEWGNATLRGFHDVSDKHEGYEVSADYAYRWTRGRLSVSPTVGVTYKNSKLSDYYWGVHPGEASNVLFEYHPDGGLGWEAGLHTNYYLTKNVRLALSANYERLQHDIAQSPLVDQDYVFGYFAGFGWQF
ncbi:MAG TPA: MipA/OmpV family protein [Steroidobacteraceae bacterium]|nr:MipA/OmpV family protein [Steroidobacteraceae bacterium]